MARCRKERFSPKLLALWSPLFFWILFINAEVVSGAPVYATANVMANSLCSSPDFSSPWIGKIEFSPYGRLGYRKVSWSARVPFPYVVDTRAPNEFLREFYRIRLPAVDLWLAEAGIDASFGGGNVVGARISGNLLQGILNNWLPETRDEAERLLWSQRNFNWVEFELYALKPVWKSLCFKSGVRYDDFSLAFKIPYEIETASESEKVNVTFRAYQADSHVWLPYLGFGWNGAKMKAFIIASVFAPSSISMESRIAVTSPRASSFSCYTTFFSDKPASYLELSLEYAVDIKQGMNFRIWGKSGWLQAAGKALSTATAFPASILPHSGMTIFT